MIWPDGSRYSFENVIKDDAHCIKWNLLTRPEMPLLLWADLFHSFNFSTPSYGDEIMPNLMYIVNSYLICRTTFYFTTGFNQFITFYTRKVLLHRFYNTNKTILLLKTT